MLRRDAALGVERDGHARVAVEQVEVVVDRARVAYERESRRSRIPRP